MVWRPRLDSGWLIVPILLVHLIWVGVHREPSFCSPDANGYLAQARFLAETGSTAHRPEAPAEYIGVHWLDTHDGRFFSRYPPGLPVLLTPVFLVGGFEVALWVDPVLATLSVFLLFLLVRRSFGNALGLIAAVSFAVLPVLNEQVLAGFAHVAITAFLLAGINFLDKWNDAPTATRAFAAGLVLGCLPTIRYRSAIMGIGVGVFMLTECFRRKRFPDLLAALGGAAIPIVPLAVRNRLAFGSFAETGYGLTKEQGAFSLDYFREHALPQLADLLQSGGVVFPVGVIGLVALLARRESRSFGLLLAGIVVPLTILYASYYWRPGSFTARFFLPTFPLYIFAACALPGMIGHRRIAISGAVGLLAVHLVLTVPRSEALMDALETDCANSAAVLSSVREHIPPGSVIIADRPPQEVLQVAGAWRLADARLFPGTPARVLPPWFPSPAGADGRQQTSPIQLGRADELRRSYRDLEDGPLLDRLMADLEAWAGKQPVFWIGSQERIDQSALHLANRFEHVTTIGLAEPGAQPKPWVPRPPLHIFRWTR